jgi:hypothetical protein
MSEERLPRSRRFFGAPVLYLERQPLPPLMGKPNKFIVNVAAVTESTGTVAFEKCLRGVIPQNKTCKS